MSRCPFIAALALVLLAFTLPACLVVLDDDVLDLHGDLKGTRWELERLYVGGSGFAVTEGYRLHLRSSHEFVGVADCNAYGGAYRFGRGGHFEVVDLYSTEQFCGSDSLEPDYYDALLDADEYETERGLLFLYDRRGDLVLRFRRAR